MSAFACSKLSAGSAAVDLDLSAGHLDLEVGEPGSGMKGPWPDRRPHEARGQVRGYGGPTTRARARGSSFSRATGGQSFPAPHAGCAGRRECSSRPRAQFAAPGEQSVRVESADRGCRCAWREPAGARHEVEKEVLDEEGPGRKMATRVATRLRRSAPRPRPIADRRAAAALSVRLKFW